MPNNPIPQKTVSQDLINEINFFHINLIIQNSGGKPALELRRMTNNNEVIKLIITAAFESKPILVYPIFKNKLRAAATLCQKHVLQYNSDKGVYEYLI